MKQQRTHSVKKRSHFLILFFSFFLIQSCSQNLRIPAQSSSFIQRDLLLSTSDILSQLATEELSIDVCNQEIAEGFHYLSELPSDHFKTEYSAGEYEQIIKDIWQIKKNLRRHVGNWEDAGVMTRQCAGSIKAALRASRYIEDYVSLIYVNQFQIKNNHKKLTGFENTDSSANFSKPFPWVLSDKEDFKFREDLKSGDLLLWRGKTSISASIARLGDTETNFSHLSMVYRDEKTGKLFHMESLIETGLIVEDFTHSPLHPGSARIVVLRHKDAQLAKKAAKFAYEVASRTMGTKDHLYYDFGFDLNDHKKVFCSEIVNWAFKEASKGEVDIPLYKTHFDMKNRTFLNAIGTDAKVGFQPGDIELSPDFTMIAEWRNFNYSRANQLKDVIHSEIYRWMDDYQYNFKWSFRGNILGSLVYGTRRIPLLGNLIEDKLPLNMSRRTLSSVMTMDKVSGIIYKKMMKDLFKEDPHAIYSLADLKKRLEKIRVRDLEKFKDQVRANRNGKAHANPLFHHLLGPT